MDVSKHYLRIQSDKSLYQSRLPTRWDGLLCFKWMYASRVYSVRRDEIKQQTSGQTGGFLFRFHLKYLGFFIFFVLI